MRSECSVMVQWSLAGQTVVCGERVKWGKERPERSEAMTATSLEPYEESEGYRTSLQLPRCSLPN